MSLGKAPLHEDLFHSSRSYCEVRLSKVSVFRLLARECHRLFPDEAFKDLFKDVGRRSIPPRIVAVVMALQRLEGLSDREAVERFAFDLRWKYAAGCLDMEYPDFVHTVLVDMRERLRKSERPTRIFDAVLEVAKSAGLVGRKRVLDSTALYDAVATQDTVTLIRSAIRGVLRAAPSPLAEELRRVLKRDDDYQSAGKPHCDWEDQAARDELVDALAKDAYAVLVTLDDRKLEQEVKTAAELLATVVGQDLEQSEDGRFRIARRVAPDRVISTVDPEARHGHKTAARGFDGYKGHLSVDPDSEIIVATSVTAGNAADGAEAQTLLKEAVEADQAKQTDEPIQPLEVYGDASYGTADNLEHLESIGAEANVKVQAPSAKEGVFSKDDFVVDLDAGTVRCPAGHCASIRPAADGGGVATFGEPCTSCPLRSRCTGARDGRSVRIHPKERTLERHRQRQKDPAWRAKYRATRPKVERKFGHLMRFRHGGRRARMRGRTRVGHDFSLLAAAVNLRRLARLVVRFDQGKERWAVS
jgi:hypothetical protein